MAQRKSIAKETQLRLFSEAAGHCQRPECLQPIFPAEMGGDRHIAEMAHVVPHGENGPRHEERPAGEFDVDSFDNLILLCPSCHTIIDKDPSSYSRSILLGWKSGHLAALASKQGICAYDRRDQARDAVAAAMMDNHAVWKELAPSEGSEFEYDPESESAQRWTKRMRSIILPNSFRILGIISLNRHHLTTSEKNSLAAYKEHVRGLVERHICDNPSRGIRFPDEINGIFE